MDSATVTPYIPAIMNDVNPAHAGQAADASHATPTALSGPRGIVRTVVGGLLMGAANLIPGISGGTMILAMGLYTEFIDSIADVTRLRLKVGRIAFLGLVGAAAVAAIFGLAGVILYLLFRYNVAMYALFIGLTLGGAPKLASMLRPMRGAAVAIIAGIALMAVIALLKTRGLPHNVGMDVVAGVIGATTMVLPGISGSYMLLILDQYDRVIGAVHERDFAIIIPVGIGAIAGVVILSNALKYLLHHHERATIGFLLGMLLGSVLGLWPFGRQPGEKLLEERTPAELRAFAVARGIPGVAAAADSELAPRILANWGNRSANDYAPGDISAAVVMLIGGFAATFALGRQGGGTSEAAHAAAH